MRPPSTFFSFLSEYAIFSHLSFTSVRLIPEPESVIIITGDSLSSVDRWRNSTETVGDPASYEFFTNSSIAILSLLISSLPITFLI